MASTDTKGDAPKTRKMKIKPMKRACRQGFTLIELLVVIAIIAVIGAGVAVTYQKLDEQAKTAMEISDLAILKKVTKHWSAINDYALPNEMDSLVDTEGNLYTSFKIGGTASSDGNGLLGPIGYATLEAQEAPDVVLNNLAVAGMDTTYLHLPTRTPANDSTFETSDFGAGTFGSSVNTDSTRATLVVGDSEARADAAEVVADGGGAAHAYDGPDDIEGNADDVDYSFTATSGTVFGGYGTLADWTTEQANQQAILDAITTDKLAFVYPGGGTNGAPNFNEEIITNAGLKPEQVADPTVAPSGEQKYYLVVMGFGRFASIYQGKSVRTDAPAYGKRSDQTDSDYNRYLGVIRVPVDPYGGPGNTVDPPVMVDVLSPQGYSVASLRDNFIDDQERIRDDT